VLGDPDRRTAYDRELAAREREVPKVQGPSASAPQQSAAPRDGSAGVKPSPVAPGRQRVSDTAAAANARPKKRGLSRKAIVALVLVILFYAPWAWHTYQRFSSGGHAANTARSAASSVTWTNPVTHASVSIDGIWKLSVTGAETGQPVYTFTEANGSAAIVFAHEDLPGVGFNKYIPAYIRNNAATMPLGAPGIRETIDGHESWSTDGHLSSAPSMKTHAELRHIGPSFWRLVVVQAPPYEQTDDATRTLKAQLWATLASF